MDVDVRSDIVIARPREAVAAYAAEPGLLVMPPAIRRANRKDLARLKQILESRA